MMEKICLKITTLESSHMNGILSGSTVFDIANYVSCSTINDCCTLISILKTKINSSKVASLNKQHGYQLVS